MTWSIAALLSAAAFGFLLWGVLAHNGLTFADPAVATFVAGHRPAWLTPVMEAGVSDHVWSIEVILGVLETHGISS